jgi:hypothetical protein
VVIVFVNADIHIYHFFRLELDRWNLMHNAHIDELMMRLLSTTQQLYVLSFAMYEPQSQSRSLYNDLVPVEAQSSRRERGVVERYCRQRANMSFTSNTRQDSRSGRRLE